MYMFDFFLRCSGRVLLFLISVLVTLMQAIAAFWCSERELKLEIIPDVEIISALIR